ncbi:MAG: flagellar M-ring protein FliF [Lachnospiraceae bacterium]|nr:flagellar M-ring protein FliF [Lachnospiraceae bacterium]
MGEKIIEKIKELWAKLVEWWNHFTSKQKTVIVIAGVAVVLAFVGLFALLTKPNYVILTTCDSTKEASSVVETLKGENIPCVASEDGLQIRIPREYLSVANLALGASGITTDTYTLETALSSSFTTTEADKQKKYVLYLENKFETDIVNSFSAIKTASVTINLPDNDGTLLATKEQAGAKIVLGIDGDFDKENANNLAKAFATVLGCPNTDTIVILNTEAELLFSGSDESSSYGNASSQMAAKAEAEKLVSNDVKSVLIGTGEFGDLKVSTNLKIDFSSTEDVIHKYTPADGQAQGVLAEEKSYTSESTGGTSGVPGTDSNTETTYYYKDNDYSSETIEEFYKKYLPNEEVVTTNIPPGVINYAGSSVAVSSTNYVMVREDSLKAQGVLDGITWEEYKAANSERKQLPVSEDMITLVSNATGFSTSNISILSFEENIFVDSEGSPIDIYDAIQVALIVIILALLAFVVIRSMRTEKEPEEAEELSVETLLQTNPEPVLDDIEFEESSETRKMIEKFVDENPEAVANLLRNWLNEEWG